jgi:diguanylate cyclase (GGDEF)-like protein
MAESLGFSEPSELVGKTDIDLFGPAFGQRTLMEDLRIMESDTPIIGLVESRQVGDSTNWTLTTKVPLHDAMGAVVGLMGITREINELKRTELDLQHLATHDPLTGLPNRYLMTDRLRQVLAYSERTATRFGVLFIDVDDFKGINDARGHEYGDAVLRSIGATLVRTVRGSDTVARIGGDEFVIILESIGQSADAGAVAAKILRSIAEPFTIKRRKVQVTVSIGVAIFPDNGRDAELLLRAADYAMYMAKGEGKDRWHLCPKGLRGAVKDFRPD